MRRLLGSNGEYFFRAFYGKKGIFRIIGTKMTASNHNNPLLAIDTFVSDTGVVVEIKRQEVLAQVNLGKMLPVPESEIVASTRSQKDYNKIASSKS